MAIGERDFNLTENFEGYATVLPDGSCIAYWDAIGGVWTIGFGSTGADVRENTRWTRDEAVHRLQLDWMKAYNGVLQASPCLAAFPNRLDAVVDFSYNEGVSRYVGSSMRSYINRQAWLQAALEFPKWDISRGKVIAGLQRRRKAEQLLFQTPDTHGHDESQDDPAWDVSKMAQSLPVVRIPLAARSSIDPVSSSLADSSTLPQGQDLLDSSSIPSLFSSFGKRLWELIRNPPQI